MKTLYQVIDANEEELGLYEVPSEMQLGKAGSLIEESFYVDDPEEFLQENGICRVFTEPLYI